MSWLCIIILLFWLLGILRGFRRGLVRTAISMVSFVLVTIVVMAINPTIERVLTDNTRIRDQIESSCNRVVDNVLGEDSELTRAMQVQAIEALPVPDLIKQPLLENNNNVIYDMLSVDSFTGYVSGFMTSAIMKAIAFLISFIIAIIIIKIITHFLDAFANLPILGGINRVGGLMLGFIQGLLNIWIFFLIVSIFTGTEIGANLMREIAGDRILSYLYDNNLILQALLAAVTQ